MALGLRRRRAGGRRGIGGRHGTGTPGAARGGVGVGGAKELTSDVGHIVEFAFRQAGRGVEARLGEKNELAEIAESGGAAIGDAVCGNGFEDALEGAVNVEAAVGFTIELGEFGREIVFGCGGPFVNIGVGAAIVANGGGHGAGTAVGKLEVAEVGEGGVLSAGGHRIDYIL